MGIAFPELDSAARRRLVVESFANLGRCVAEVCLLQGRHRDELLAGVSVEGLENLETARSLSPSGGVIALSAHLGSWELCAAVMARRGVPISVVHHEMRNPHLERMIHRWRAASGMAEIPMGRAALGVLRALARGRIVVMLLDQDAHREEGVFVPFLGRAASTRSAPARIAMSRGVPVLPVFIFRVAATPRHVIRLLPPLVLEPAPEPGSGLPDGERCREEPPLRRNVASLNRVIEQAVRRAPDHWLWAHRRWKTRPEGEPPLYPRRRRRRRR